MRLHTQKISNSLSNFFLPMSKSYIYFGFGIASLQFTLIAQEGKKELHITLHGTHAITFTEER
jgi:hypothetical protein